MAAVPRLLLNKNNSGGPIVQANFFFRSAVFDLSHHIAVKRIMQEARELANDPSTEYSASPLEVCAIL
jgi:hypothetical protein